MLFRPLVDSAEVAVATGIDGGGIASRSFSSLDSVGADGATVGNTMEPPAKINMQKITHDRTKKRQCSTMLHCSSCVL